MRILNMISNTTRELINLALLNLELENPTQEAINEACRKNDKINCYNFLVTSIKQ